MASQRTPTEEKKSGPICQWFRRVKTIFRKKQPTGPAATSAPITSDEPATTTARATEPEDVSKSKVMFENAYQREKARELFKKYGMDLDVENWIIKPIDPSRRVEKKIRMRVRRTCHQCQTTFGSGGTCPGCDHRFCQECTRYPAKKKNAKDQQPVQGKTATETEQPGPSQSASTVPAGT